MLHKLKRRNQKKKKTLIGETGVKCQMFQYVVFTQWSAHLTAEVNRARHGGLSAQVKLRLSAYTALRVSRKEAAKKLL